MIYDHADLVPPNFFCIPAHDTTLPASSGFAGLCKSEYSTGLIQP